MLKATETGLALGRLDGQGFIIQRCRGNTEPPLNMPTSAIGRLSSSKTFMAAAFATIAMPLKRVTGLQTALFKPSAAPGAITQDPSSRMLAMGKTRAAVDAVCLLYVPSMPPNPIATTLHLWRPGRGLPSRFIGEMTTGAAGIINQLQRGAQDRGRAI